ncbi:MAG TPA: glycosyltransferase family 61 protein [Cyclobacteriaceae bacterium]|nr:glycosyltransferase family 61 protein [Cyclobacteriaceae bacterium]
MGQPSNTGDFKYVILLTTNSLIFKDVNVNSQLLLWKNGRILNESKLNLVDTDFYRSSMNYLRFIAINYFRRKKKRVEGKTVWVIDQWAGNYYHWFVEALPKILSTRLDKSEFVVMMPSTYKDLLFHEESLKMMGVRWAYFDVVSERLNCEELYLPLNVSIAGTTNPFYINKVRDQLSAGVRPAKTNRRIYVSRRSTKRRVDNEDEVVIFLKPHGFEIVEFEKMTFTEQINLCSTSAIMVGLHGAGLTNMLFMSAAMVVVELRRENEDNFCYQYLAQALNMRYHYLECKNLGVDRYNSDFSVNLPEFKKLIEPLLS